MALTVEPVMHVVIYVAQELAARVADRVRRHRGLVHSSEHRDGVQTVEARVPQAEVPAFVSALLADTNGRVRTSMSICDYWPVADHPPGDPTAGVREPRPKAPISSSGAMALPEPKTDDDRLD